MKKIKETKVNIGTKEVIVGIYGLDNSDELKDLSRVYVVAVDADNNVPLIYNSKRDIWGFPGGHVEEGESIDKAALRESIEEIKKTITKCAYKFMLINKIDNEKEEKQIICFARVGEDSTDFKDENESVKQVIYTPISEIISKIGNEELWNVIIESLNEWVDYQYKKAIKTC